VTRPSDPVAHRLAAAWAVGLAVLLLVPLPGSAESPTWLPAVVDLGADKLLHAALFFGAGRAFLRAARAAELESPALVAVLAAIAYGGALEIVQGWVGRDASWADLAADALGAAFAATPLPFRRPAQ
jgi:VanZ family protein